MTLVTLEVLTLVTLEVLTLVTLEVLTLVTLEVLILVTLEVLTLVALEVLTLVTLEVLTLVTLEAPKLAFLEVLNQQRYAPSERQREQQERRVRGDCRLPQNDLDIYNEARQLSSPEWSDLWSDGVTQTNEQL